MDLLSGDAYRTAAALMETHGAAGARRIAQRRANDFLDARDFEASARWKAVLDAVRELAHEAPPPGRRPN